MIMKSKTSKTKICAGKSNDLSTPNNGLRPRPLVCDHDQMVCLVCDHDQMVCHHDQWFVTTTTNCDVKTKKFATITNHVKRHSIAVTRRTSCSSMIMGMKRTTPFIVWLCPFLLLLSRQPALQNHGMRIPRLAARKQQQQQPPNDKAFVFEVASPAMVPQRDSNSRRIKVRSTQPFESTTNSAPNTHGLGHGNPPFRRGMHGIY